MKVKSLSRKFILVLIDLCICVSVFAGVRFVTYASSSSVKMTVMESIVCGLAFLLAVFACRLVLRIYSNIWRYANSKAYLELIFSDMVAGVIVIASLHKTQYYMGIWQSLATTFIITFLTLASRLVYQQNYRAYNTDLKSANKIGVAIVGAGMVGSLLAQELIYNEMSHYKPLVFIDKDPSKVGSNIFGLKVLPENDKTVNTLRTMPVQEIFIALPNASKEDIQNLYSVYGSTKCKIKVYDFLNEDKESNTNSKRTIREVNIEDLLYRDSVRIQDKAALDIYRDKTVLVTGGGGSIGSEICRQIAKLKPRRLIVLDIYENNAYEVQQELIRKYGSSLDLEVEIASVRDRVRLEAIFKAYRPQIVLHAAAHKHVPLMEHSACEAIKNNVIGTYNTADMAEKYGVERFVLISTDKAVNPTNIMGASKRMCEMVVNCRTDSQTVFSAVRFGNVLGSNGSVVPLFKKQIAAGGPVTITDKRIVRFFMTIREATQLVMEAGAMAGHGDLFVLDMGKPVRIVDMAEDMIRLSGFRPYKDIDIVEIGLRPGEKLYEELLVAGENLTTTANQKIFVEQQTTLSRQDVEDKIAILLEAVHHAENGISTDGIKEAMKMAVPTYKDPDEVNANTEVEEMKQAEEKHQEIRAEVNT